ncbi:MAG: twin-arginine translocase subunit TatC [Gammaproteobacteria bacterium]|nr:twin-arginine translocase subunit TatC [Gammaproteobacteria bacterium]
MSRGPQSYPPDRGQPFVAHLIELRRRLMVILGGMTLIFLALVPFTNELYAELAKPLIRYLPQGSTMIATEVASTFFAPFKFTMFCALFLSIPLLLHQIWGFVAPGLYRRERRIVLPLLVSSTLLFYLGMVFAYFVVFPLMFKFFISTAPAGVTVMTDITQYLDFVLKLFFSFGLAFEVPVITVIVVWAGFVSADQLAAKRSYVIVGAFIIGMILTPPDVFSQTLLAVPMWLLFEVGLLCSRFVARRQPDETAEEASAD